MPSWQTRRCVYSSRAGNGERQLWWQAMILISANDIGHGLSLSMKVVWWTIQNSPAKRGAPGEEFTDGPGWPARLQWSSCAALDARTDCRNDGDRSVCIWRVFASAGKPSQLAQKMG